MRKLPAISVIGLIIINCTFVILALGPMPPYGAYLARLYPNNQHENHYILLPETELDLVVLDCQASGTPDPKITFFKDGSLIRNDLIPGIRINESMVSSYNYWMLNISGKVLKIMQFLLFIHRTPIL